MTLRVNGFSGMDVDSMVKQLMTAKRIPLDKLNQQKTYLSWQRDSYRELNSKIFDFKQNKLTDTFGKSISMSTRQAVLTGNTDAIKADATAGATGASMTVNVTQLATKANIQPQGKMEAAEVKDANGAVVTPVKTASLSTTLAGLSAYKVSTPPPAVDMPEEFQLTINKTDLKFASTDSITTVISKINSSQAGVIASFNEISGEFSFTAKDFGSTDIAISESYTGTPTKNVTMLQLLNVDPNLSGKNNSAKGSVVEVSTLNSDGTSSTPVTFNSKNNTVAVNGITITLLKESKGSPTSIATTVDPTKAVDTIKAFVQNYNDLLKTMNTKVDEEKYRDFSPLTDEQRSSMKESEITSWEAKAKSGLLKNDDILKGTISSMRSIINESLGPLSSMGITTGQYYEGGKLYIDEDKLKLALQSNPQQATEVFQGSGIFNKLNTAMTETMKKFSDRAGTNKFSGDLSSAFKSESVMGKALKDYTSRIAAMTTRLNDAETRYYKQFSAMETAMNKLQSQSSSLFGSTS
ncbi:flagellar hook-associated protein 2 [Paenibacillus shirakamiensis]|uniref:Flagellar hook-associated protein 2 n=1 Tax=Paenibacillus shirakamiensis TaxID=1265935 RepID=A0ABS4JJ87_9BACL|nr:flagellar filament capping protein FliD [Paenibacillus shirakamiensis]MBP2001772.1 flagellar hook-associated protein 2 [Paenibacillus shirakamiensis]